MFYTTSTAVIRPSSKARNRNGRKGRAGDKTACGRRVYKCENGDKCTSFLSGTSHVEDSALRQLHVTVEQQTEKERETHKQPETHWEKEEDEEEDV